MKFSRVAALVALVSVGPTFAADKHDHAHEHESMHGGVVVEVKDLDLELVAKPEVIQLHLRDHGKPVDVANGSAKLTGSVETDVERDLAEQLALGIEGVTKVDNQLKVDPNVESQVSSKPTMAQRFDDATTVATVKSKLLWNSNTEGLDIKVQADNGNLTLSGDAQSQAAKDLAGSLASNTDGVRKVDNQIRVSGDATAAAKTQNAADDAGQAISDVWITSKVKSSFIYNRNLDGLDISVTTKDGQVSLGGSVSSSAQKQLAVETARNIRGVRGVNADALKVAG